MRYSLAVFTAFLLSTSMTAILAAPVPIGVDSPIEIVKRGPPKSSNIKPISDRVIVKSLDRTEVTKSGIIIPDTAKEKPQEGKVLPVGGKLEKKKK